jgi:Fe-S cluster assembly iron-binding protein IscA
MSTFEELLDPMTADEARTLLRELVITSPAQIAEEVLDTPTTSEAAIVYALGEAEATRSDDRAFFARSATRSTATAPHLRVIANEQFSLPPKEQTFATTDIELDNTSDSTYGPYDARQFIVRNENTKKLYANVEEITSIAPGASGMVIGVEAVEAGTESDALPNEITELETPLAGVTITNPAAALAQDEEGVTALNGRIDAKIGSLGEPGARGWNTGATSTAFEAVAKNGPDDLGGCVREDGSRIDVTRTQVVRNDVTGDITLYVADDDGPLVSGDVTTVEEAVQLYTEWLGLEVSVENSTLVTVTYSGTLTIYSRGSSSDDDAITAQIDVELLAAGRALQIGEGPTLDYGKNAILNAGDSGKATAFRVKSLVLSAPLADTVLSDGEVVSMVRGTITIVRV